MGVRRRGNQQRRAAQADQNSSTANATVQVTEKAARASSHNDAAKLTPGFDEAFASIESMYVDELKPFGRILRKRVAERALAADGVTLTKEENLPDVDIKHLRTICEESDLLHVEPEEGGDWSVVIVGRPQTFVDVYSSVDLYPAGMWGAAAAYFQLLGEDNMYLPGGRYSCAQALQARELAFLKGRSLGKICHIVQLAISQKKLLGYLNGAVVPYAFSQSRLKEECAQLNAPCTVSASDGAPEAMASEATSGDNGLAMASWDTARQYLRDILDSSATSSPDSIGTVPLSNVKRLFRSKFKTELSETKLGHSKLSELLQDERFHDICHVQLQGHGYIVVQVEAQLPQKAEENRAISLSDALSMVAGEPLRSSAQWPCSNAFIGGLVQRTFIHASLPPPTPPPNARKRSSSLPKDIGSGKENLEPRFASLCAGAENAEDTESTVDSRNGSASEGCGSGHDSDNSIICSLEDPVKVILRACSEQSTTGPVDSQGDFEAYHRIQFCPDEPLALEEAVCFLESGPLTQTPMGMYSPSAVPQLPLLSQSLGFKDGNEGAEDKKDEDVEQGARRRLLFCPDEPLSLEEAGVFIDSSPLTQTPTSKPLQSPEPMWGLNSSASFVKYGHVGSIALSKVQNTFIHSPLPPPTPLRVGASGRSRSLPKNVGSHKNELEATYRALGCSHFPATPLQVGETLPTPSVYGDYSAPNVLSSLSEPMYVPPTPSSPMYCSSAYHCGGVSKSLPVCISGGLLPANDYMWPRSADESEYLWQSSSDSSPPNVIRLASLLQ